MRECAAILAPGVLLPPSCPVAPPPFPAGIGTAIEFWKVTKAMDVSLLPAFPFISIKDRASYSNNPTKEHDATAMRYLSYALYPLVIGYSIYALKYETHKSWYSWALGSLVGAVYAFGFILMCPQVGDATGAFLCWAGLACCRCSWRRLRVLAAGAVG